MKVDLFVESGGNFYQLADIVMGGVKLTSKRALSPAELTFEVVRDMADGGIAFFEGDRVRLSINDVNLFVGYIFTKIRNKDNIIKVTAYDQIRYLKNRDTYFYTASTASELVNMIALDFNLVVGEIQNSGFVINDRIENDQEMLDIINNAVLLTYRNNGKLMVLYDDCGELTFKDSNNMKLPFLLASEDTGIINYAYVSDINEDTYNKVKLFKRDDRKGLFQNYVVGDKVSQGKIGVLQHYQKIDENISDVDAYISAKEILKQKNRVRRELSVECICNDGEELIRAGNKILVKIDDLGDKSVNNWLLIDKCVHIIENNEHRVKLDFMEI